MPKGTLVAKYAFNYPDASVEAFFPTNSVEEANAIVKTLVEDDQPLKVYLTVGGTTMSNPTTLKPSLDVPITTSLFGFLTVYTIDETVTV